MRKEDKKLKEKKKCFLIFLLKKEEENSFLKKENEEKYTNTYLSNTYLTKNLGIYTKRKKKWKEDQDKKI